VQIGAFKNKFTADTLAQNSTINGYQAIVKSYNGDGQGLYRVIISGFNSLDEARDFAKSGKYEGAFAISLD
ncbi:MAG: rare lipoprotein, partial [Pseudomonadota bacterium]